jgi:hypothetical protein
MDEGPNIALKGDGVPASRSQPPDRGHADDLDRVGRAM